jgi:hypothetical protein
LESLAESIGEVVEDEFPQGVTARMAIPAHWCLIHTVPAEKSTAGLDSAAYTFEEHVPVELERLTWAMSKQNNARVLVAAVFTEGLEAFLKKLEGFRVCVERLAVDAALLLDEQDSHFKDGDGFVLVDASHATLAGRSSRSDASAFIRSVRHDGSARSVSRHIWLTEAETGLSSEQWRLMRRGDTAPTIKDDVRSLSGEETARRVLSALLRDEGGMDLRRGALAFAGRWETVHRRLQRCAATALLLFVILGLRWRVENAAYERSLEQLRSLQAQAYQRVFPASPVHAGATLRLRSERIKLESLTKGTAPSGLRSHAGMDVFRLLHATAAGIPAHVKLNVQEIDVDDGRVRVIGHTTDHTAAGEWVQALNKTGTVQADPPRTTLRKDGTVEFRIHAQGANENGPG